MLIPQPLHQVPCVPLVLSVPLTSPVEPNAGALLDAITIATSAIPFVYQC